MFYKEIFDISLTLGEETGATPVGPFEFCQHEMKIGSDVFFGSEIHVFAHEGTHVDSPCHLSPFKKTVDQYPLDRFVIPATVVEIEDKEVIREEELHNVDLRKGEALLFKTENSRCGRSLNKEVEGNFVYLSLGALEYALEKGITLLGFDYGVMEPSPEVASVHHRCFENDTIILEGLNLANVDAGSYILVALPLKIKGIEASPVRAVLLKQ